jgi:hypothetical protein
LRLKEAASKSSSSSSSDSSSSSSEEDEQPRPKRDSSPAIPFLPFFVGIQGSKIGTSKKIDIAKTVIKLATKIGSDLENPSSLIDENTLARFTTMAKIVRTMDREQIDDVTKALQVGAPKNPSRSDNIKRAAW